MRVGERRKARGELSIAVAGCIAALGAASCHNAHGGASDAGGAGGSDAAAGESSGGAGGADSAAAGSGGSDATAMPPDASEGAAGATGGGVGATPDGAADASAASADSATGTITLTFKNYEVTGTFPRLPTAFAQRPGQLLYTKIVVSDEFLAESCAIGDYNGDGVPDISSGRTWYEGTNDPTTTFKTKHPFRDGHGALPATGAMIEINTGVSDDVADFPWDVDGDGDTDIIDIAQTDVPETNDPTSLTPGVGPDAAGTPNKFGTVQPHGTAYWYENPGKDNLAGDPKWTPHLIHPDVKAEQHAIVDINGDGFPEILGACRSCSPLDTKGYYQGDPTNPKAQWRFHSVTVPYTFPFNGLGHLHGLGAGDVNGDGLPDLLERGGAWLQQPGGTWNATVCTDRNTPAGCGWIKEKTPLITFPAGSDFYMQVPGAMVGFYDSAPDAAGNKGGSHMYAADMDQDGCVDVVSADWAHGFGLFWYRQQKEAGGACSTAFQKFQFLGDAVASTTYPTPAVPGDAAKWGAGFTEPHALQVVDMDGDGRPDVVAGKMRFAQPIPLGDRDPHGTPFLFVFRSVAKPDARTGAPITLEPHLIDGDPTATEGTPAAGMGVGQQIAIGHANGDGILDICVATKVGLAVFLGK